MKTLRMYEDYTKVYEFDEQFKLRYIAFLKENKLEADSGSFYDFLLEVDDLDKYVVSENFEGYDFDRVGLKEWVEEK